MLLFLCLLCSYAFFIIQFLMGFSEQATAKVNDTTRKFRACHKYGRKKIQQNRIVSNRGAEKLSIFLIAMMIQFRVWKIQQHQTWKKIESKHLNWSDVEMIQFRVENDFVVCRSAFSCPMRFACSQISLQRHRVNAR